MSNMAAAVASRLNENVLRINEALEKSKKHLLQRVRNFDEKIAEQQEDISTSDFKCSMAAALDSLKENLQIVNETIEKAKKHLLQRIHENPDVKIDVKQDLAEQMMNKVQDIRAEVEKAHDELNNLEEKFRQLDDMMKEFDGKQVELLSNDP